MWRVFIRNLNFLVLLIKGVFIKVRKPTWRTLAVRNWELVLYKYANVSVLESSAPSVRARTGRCLSHCGFDAAGALPLLPFCLVCVDPFFFDIAAVAASFFFIYHVAIPKFCSLSLLYNNSGHYREVILVWISCPSEMPVFCRYAASSKSTEILSIRCTFGLISPSSIWTFAACQEMICIE